MLIAQLPRSVAIGGQRRGPTTLLSGEWAR